MMKTETKQTQKWKVIHGAHHFEVRDSEGHAVAFTGGVSDTAKEHASLLAAAPDLLEALENIVNGCLRGEECIDSDRLKQARAAIAKVKGQ